MSNQFRRTRPPVTWFLWITAPTETTQVTRKKTPRTSPTGPWQQTIVSVGMPLSTGTGGTGEIHLRQNHIHENIGLSPDDRQGEGDGACSQEGDVEEPPAEHQLLRRHAVVNERDCGPGRLSAIGPPGRTRMATHLYGCEFMSGVGAGDWGWCCWKWTVRERQSPLEKGGLSTKEEAKNELKWIERKKTRDGQRLVLWENPR